MSFLWSIYAQEIKEKRSNPFLHYLLGEIIVDRKMKWLTIIHSYFTDYEIEQVDFGDSIRIYLKKHPTMGFINLGKNHIELYFHKNFLPHFNSFIEQMFLGEAIGISFGGCDVTLRNNDILSIQRNGVELYKDGLDQLKNQLVVL